MYADHFKLTGHPFIGDPASEFFMPNATVAAAIFRVRQTLLARDAIGIITGAAGVGKTAFIERALKPLENQASVIHTSHDESRPERMLDEILYRLNEGDDGGDVRDTLNHIGRRIAEHNAEGRSVSIAVDLDTVSATAIEGVRTLIDLTRRPGTQLNILLQGPHTLHKELEAQGMIQIRQRIGFRHMLQSLTLKETGEYLKFQLDKAGRAADEVLATGAFKTVFSLTAGIPRLINTIMDAALSDACIERSEQLTDELISKSAARLGYKAITKGSGSIRRTPAATPAPSTPSTAKSEPAVELSLEGEGETPTRLGKARHEIQAEPVDHADEVSDETARLLLDAGGITNEG